MNGVIRRLIVFLLFVNGHFCYLLAQNTAPNDVYVKTLIDSLPQHSVGGLAVDAMGYVYSADFNERIWKINPYTKEVSVFVDGLYGTSGMTFDARGNLYQSNIGGNFISKIDRDGNKTVFADSLIQGPVGLAFNSKGDLFVCNCHSQSIARVSPDGAVSTFIEPSGYMNCPNGLVFDLQDNLYVVNFGDNNVLKITPEEEISIFAQTPGKIGNGHIAILKHQFFVTGFHGHEVYRLDSNGALMEVYGTGNRGLKDGKGNEANFSYPNGIAVDPDGKTIYVNEMGGEIANAVNMPGKGTIRTIRLKTIDDLMKEKIENDGIIGLVDYYKDLRKGRFKNENTSLEMNALGYNYMITRKFKEAEVIFQLNLESYPSNTTSYARLARTMYIIGETKKAREYYKKALELSPSSKYLKLRLQMLEDD